MFFFYHASLLINLKLSELIAIFGRTNNAIVMKRFFFLIAVTIAALTFASCSKETKHDIVGTWRVVYASLTIDGKTTESTDDNSDVYYEFKSNGTYLYYGSKTQQGSYSYNEELGKLTYQTQGSSTSTTVDIVWVSNNEITWTDMMSYGSLKMTLKRK